MSMMEHEPVRSRAFVTDEVKRDAVALVIDEDRTVVDVARSLGVAEGTLGNCAVSGGYRNASSSVCDGDRHPSVCQAGR